MANEKKQSTVEVARQLALPLLEEMGLLLWDVRFEKEGAGWYLRYLIDKEDGLTIQDCEDFSKGISKALDAADPIDQSYMLEVSSPGVERELVKDWHFQEYIGADVHVRLIRPVDGVRDFIGQLESKEGDRITILLEDELSMTIGKNEAAFIRLYVDFETGGLEG